MRARRAASAADEGFALIALVVAIFVILLFLGVAAPIVARDLRRERELEAVHRGNQYVRAIRLYYLKFGRYPGSIEQLEKTNNIRFLRKQYVDPMTGKPDWRIILVGQNKTTVKGLFGQPLSGLSGAGGIGGSSISGTSTPGTSAGSSAFSSSSSGSSSFGAGTSSTGTSGSAFGGSSSSPAGTGSTTGTTGSSAGGLGSNSATDFKGGGGPFMGIGSTKSGESIITLNEKTDYSAWEFIYDPRIEQLTARSSLFGGGGAGATSATSNSLSSFGSSNSSSGSNSNSSSGSNNSGFGSGSTSPTSGTGTSIQR